MKIYFNDYELFESGCGNYLLSKKLKQSKSTLPEINLFLNS